MLRKEKEQKLEQYAGAVEEAGFAIFLDPSGIGIRLMNEIRGKLSEQGAGALHLKNTLARIIFERDGMEELCETLVGPTLMIYGGGDVGTAAKLVGQYQKDFRGDILTVRGVWFDDRLYPAEDFSSFAQLLTKDELRSQLVRVLKEPARRLASLMSDTYGRLVRVLGKRNIED